MSKYRIEYAYFNKEKLTEYFTLRFEADYAKWYFGANWHAFEYETAKDTWHKREYVIKDQNDNIVAFFSWYVEQDLKKIQGIAVLKSHKETKLPIKLILQRLKKDFEVCDIDIITFRGFEGGYPDKLYKKLFNKGLISFDGIVPNDAKLSDGKIYNSNNWSINKKQLDTIIKKFNVKELEIVIPNYSNSDFPF